MYGHMARTAYQAHWHTDIYPYTVYGIWHLAIRCCENQNYCSLEGELYLD